MDGDGLHHLVGHASVCGGGPAALHRPVLLRLLGLLVLLCSGHCPLFTHQGLCMRGQGGVGVLD